MVCISIAGCQISFNRNISYINSIVVFRPSFNIMTNFSFSSLLFHNSDPRIVIVGDIVMHIMEILCSGFWEWWIEKNRKTLMQSIQNVKILNLIGSVQVRILMRALRVLDILVIVIIVITAAALIYIFWPLIVAIMIMAAGYFIYRWYMKRKRWNSD